MITATDFYCGAGGSSLGLSQIPEVVVTQAVDLWKQALETHEANHPGALHDQADLSAALPSRYSRTDIAWFSPPCTKHSKAGNAINTDYVKLQHTPDWEELRALEADDSRAQMFEVVRYSQHHKYEVVLVENVPEVTSWSLFPLWVQSMRDLGYSYNYLLVNSAYANHHGPAVPQSRIRYYGMFWLGDKYPIWPEFSGPALGAKDFLEVQAGPLLHQRTQPLAPSTLRKIHQILGRYPLDSRLLLKYYGTSEFGSRITEPFPTLPTKDHVGVITRLPGGVIGYRMMTLLEKARAGGFGDNYIWPHSQRRSAFMIGNSVTSNAARDIAWPLVECMKTALN